MWSFRRGGWISVKAWLSSTCCPPVCQLWISCSPTFHILGKRLIIIWLPGPVLSLNGHNILTLTTTTDMWPRCALTLESWEVVFTTTRKGLIPVGGSVKATDSHESVCETFMTCYCEGKKRAFVIHTHADMNMNVKCGFLQEWTIACAQKHKMPSLSRSFWELSIFTFLLCLLLPRVSPRSFPQTDGYQSILRNYLW